MCDGAAVKYDASVERTLKFTGRQHSIAKPYIPHTAVGQAPAIIYLKVKTGERDIEYIATVREPNASESCGSSTVSPPPYKLQRVQ